MNKTIKNTLFSTIFFLLFISPALASNGWTQVYSQTVRPHQNITIGNTTITNIQFSSPVTGHINRGGILALDSTVIPELFLTVLSNNISTPIILGSGAVYENDDVGIQITASGFTDSNSLLWEYSQYNPSATLSINTWTQDLPSLSITLTPQYSSIEFGKYQNMNLKADITNTGSILFSADITTDTNHMFSASNTKQTITLKPSTTQTLNWNVVLPQEYGFYILNITATVPDIIVNYPDRTHITKTLLFKSNTTFQITPPQPGITIQKTIPSRLYTCINTSAIIVVSNNGILNAENLIITDSITSGFESSSNTFIWNASILKSGTQLTLYEKLIPINPGSYTFKGTSATYIIEGQQYSNTSNTPTTQVISTGKKCTSHSVQIINITPEPTIIKSPTPIQVFTPVPLETIQTTQPKTTILITPVPTIPTTISLPEFESIFAVLGLLVAYKLRKGR